VFVDVVLIQPYASGSGLNEASIEPPLGLAYIAAFLEQYGYSCRIIDAHLERLDDSVILSLIPPSTRLVGISMNSFSYDAACRLALEIMRIHDCAVVLGGPVPTAVPEQVLRDAPGTIVVQGEGEFPLLAMMDNLFTGRSLIAEEIPGVAWLDKEGCFQCNSPRRIPDLDILPFPAYHLLPPLSSYRSRSRGMPARPLITSRGCSFGCSFCSKDVFQRRVTWRSVGNVLAEIDFLVLEYGIRQLDILDDNIALDADRLEATVDGLLARDYRLAINIQTGMRTETLSERLLQKMRSAGFFKLAFGIESADPELLKLHGKKLDLEKLEKITALARRMGFLVYGFFIIGLPGETEESFSKTMAFLKRCKFDVANFSMAIPFIGTDLYRMVEDQGRFLIDTQRNISSGFNDGRVFFEYGGCNERVILDRYKRAYREYYTLFQKLSTLSTIRSLAELRWLWSVTVLVIKGFVRKNGKTASRG